MLAETMMAWRNSTDLKEADTVFLPHYKRSFWDKILGKPAKYAGQKQYKISNVCNGHFEYNNTLRDFEIKQGLSNQGDVQ